MGAKIKDYKKDFRIDIRATAKEKELIERTAKALGQSTSKFLLRQGIREASSIIKLSVKDSRLLEEILRNPPEPNDKLKKAAIKYKNANRSA